MCECMTWSGYGDPSWGKHHHVNCPKYATEKFAYLFYYEEAENCWTPAPDEIDCIIAVEDSLVDGEKIEIEFKRVDMTDKEIAELPEV